jgi:hypothetical protein
MKPKMKYRVRCLNVESCGGLEDYLRMPYDQSLGSDFAVCFADKKEAEDFVKHVKTRKHIIGGSYMTKNSVVTLKEIKPRTKRAKPATVREHQRAIVGRDGLTSFVPVRSHKR